MEPDQIELTNQVHSILQRAWALESTPSSGTASEVSRQTRINFGFGLMLVSIVCFLARVQAPLPFYKVTFLGAGIACLLIGAWHVDKPKNQA